MALVVDPPEPTQPEEPIKKASVAPTYRHNLIDTKEVRETAIITQIDGTPWSVEYFSQILGGDEEPTPFQYAGLDVYQQYTKIVGMEVRVTSPLSAQQDEQSAAFTVTGSANVYPFLIPNKGDIFFADVGDGQLGAFVVTNVSRKTWLKQSAYEIEYTLKNYVDADLESLVNNRVVRKLHFNKDLLKNGQYPFLVENDQQLKREFEANIRYFMERYYREFFSEEFNTFLVPGQTSTTYDLYLTKTMLRLFNPHHHILYKKVVEYNCDGEQMMARLNIWNCLLQGHSRFNDIMAQHMWLIPARSFNYQPRYGSIRYSGIGKVVYPFLTTPLVDDGYIPRDNPQGETYQNLDDMDLDLISVIENTQLGGMEDPDNPNPEVEVTQIPLIHPVLIDDYYVFSESFYNKSETGQSVLELLVNDMLSGEAIDYNKLNLLCKDIKKWGRLERFYYLPVLIILMRFVIGKF